MDDIVKYGLSSSDNFRLYRNSLVELSQNSENYKGTTIHDLVNVNRRLVVPIGEVLSNLEFDLEDYEADDPNSFESLIALLSNPYISELDKDEVSSILSDNTVNFLSYRDIKYGFEIGTYTILYGISVGIDVTHVLNRISNPKHFASRMEVYQGYFRGIDKSKVQGARDYLEIRDRLKPDLQDLG